MVIDCLQVFLPVIIKLNPVRRAGGCIGLSLGILALIVPQVAFASLIPDQGLDCVSVKESHVTATVMPNSGSQNSYSVIVKNNGSVEQSFYMGHFGPPNDSGLYTFFEIERDGSYSCTSLVKFEPLGRPNGFLLYTQGYCDPNFIYELTCSRRANNLSFR